MNMSLVFAPEILKYVVFSMYDNTNTKSEHCKGEQSKSMQVLIA